MYYQAFFPQWMIEQQLQAVSAGLAASTANAQELTGAKYEPPNNPIAGVGAAGQGLPGMVPFPLPPPPMGFRPPPSLPPPSVLPGNE